MQRLGKWYNATLTFVKKLGIHILIIVCIPRITRY